MKRIVVIGTSGCGKTTLAQTLARLIGAPHVELDAIHWKPNWTECSTEEMLSKLDAATASSRWVIDGNYRKTRDVTWPRADTIVWLDYPMSVVFTRVVIRTFRRWWHRELLWGHSRERLRMQFFHQDSLFLWVINTWRIHRRDYPKELRMQAKHGKRVLRFHTPRQTERWLAREMNTWPPRIGE